MVGRGWKRVLQRVEGRMGGTEGQVFSWPSTNERLAREGGGDTFLGGIATSCNPNMIGVC